MASRLRLWSCITLAAMLSALAVPAAHAVPLFARQTGQNCVACHAGGQFPELTPYGRFFKMTGYTIGQRTVPLSVMALVSESHVASAANSSAAANDFQLDDRAILATASLFLGGKVTDNIGAFAQVTYDRYATRDANGSFHGHSSADNMDLRYADHFVDPGQDLIVGVSVNNKPSVSDPWNTTASWMQYVPVPSPTSSAFIDGAAPYPRFAAGGNIAGVTAYAFWQRTIYAELGFYGSSRGAMSFMHAGVHADGLTKLRGSNPYWRFAWNQEWGPHSLMVGMSGMTARLYDNPLDTSDPSTLHQTRDLILDAQYQYVLDPHAATAQLVVERSRHVYPGAAVGVPSAFVDAAGNALAASNASDTTRLVRAKLSYTYHAKVGGSVGMFALSGTTNTANQTSGYSPDTLTITADPAAAAPSTQVFGNLSGNPGTRGGTLEAFWTPLQYIRAGVQYTAYDRFNGASTNYDGLGRNARDNNSLFLYVWTAY